MKQFLRQYADRIQLYTLDVLLLCSAMISLALLRGFTDWLTWHSLIHCMGLSSVCITLCMVLLRANRSLWRYAVNTDYIRLMVSYGIGCFLTFAVQTVILHFPVPSLFLLSSISLALLSSILARNVSAVFFRYRERYHALRLDKSREKRDMIILGAGNAGAMLIKEITGNPHSPYTVRALLDDAPQKAGHEISGVTVAGAIEYLPTLLRFYPQADVVLAIPSLDIRRRREIIAFCENLPCRFRLMPETIRIMEHSGNMTASMRSVRIEDLLGRTSVTFSKNELERFIKGKTVLVTGGGGSIGSELCRQLAGGDVRKLIIFDINENDSYMLYRDMKHLFGNRLFMQVEIGSITDVSCVDEIFSRYRPDVVFHAAAHKHVPLMEDAPREAIVNNIFGTWNLINAARKYRVRKFVQISTDKAVNPTNVMGATKCFCERMCRAAAAESDCPTDFVAVRFGNVLGSHGSVLPLFQIQLEHGGPITVTDKRITRYFMTIPEAAGLVIKAAAMAQRSETYILDMGKPVRILEMAENFIRLSGYKPYDEIPIIETGLRPGEKLYEELLLDDKKHKSTAVSRIFVETAEDPVWLPQIRSELALLRELIPGRNEDAVTLLRQLIPTFRPPEEVNRAYEENMELKPQGIAVPAALATTGRAD